MPEDSHETFLADFALMSTFGATAGGGVERQAATPEDGQVRAWLTDLFRKSGFEVHLDGIGNLYGLIEFSPGADYVLFGSHLDSQPMAGKYDGAYGVLAAFHAVVRVAEAHRAAGTMPKYNLAVVDWFNEEGSRFKPSMMGSAVYSGKLSIDEALSISDSGGVSVRDALTALDAVGDFTLPPIAGYAEIHIEQGPSMDDSGVKIGAVAATWCAYKYEVAVQGEQGHTGSMRMASRKDALLGAAHLITAVNELVDDFEQETLHTTVSELYVLPNSPVTIAREVRLHIDMRAENTEILDRALALLLAKIELLEQRTRTAVQFLASNTWRSGTFVEAGVKLVEDAADELGHSHARVKTLAGHDATNIKDLVPTVLVFVPSIDGISHNERELTSDIDMLAGVDVFERIVHAIVTGALD
ncbi:M20 family metallo-hydrolase [Microbacterium sp. zg.B48]|uniref:M20 family metallo-hydrolase n=1 Tax=Microbacterium sp. zg.B48 TaxID=2969408 RepID=UPI00214CE52C|nr:M20 family metallo-hydrolase [Microbacterium sp. zg.B48]MCR2762483.1 M20 family metallo-hydrolase [Microbacterium sp. zg.B48]